MEIEDLVDDIIQEHKMDKVIDHKNEDLEYKKFLECFFKEYHSPTKQQDIDNIYRITSHPKFLLLPCRFTHCIYYRLYNDKLYCINSNELRNLDELRYKKDINVLVYTIKNQGYYASSYYHNLMMYPSDRGGMDAIKRHDIYESKIFIGSLIHCKNMYKKLLPSWKIV